MPGEPSVTSQRSGREGQRGHRLIHFHGCGVEKAKGERPASARHPWSLCPPQRSPGRMGAGEVSCFLGIFPLPVPEVSTSPKGRLPHSSARRHRAPGGPASPTPPAPADNLDRAVPEPGWVPPEPAVPARTHARLPVLGEAGPRPEAAPAAQGDMPGPSLRSVPPAPRRRPKWQCTTYNQ